MNARSLFDHNLQRYRVRDDPRRDGVGVGKATACLEDRERSPRLVAEGDLRHEEPMQESSGRVRSNDRRLEWLEAIERLGDPWDPPLRLVEDTGRGDHAAGSAVHGHDAPR